MAFPVIKATGYSMFHACNLLIHCGTTQTMEWEKTPESEYLKKLPEHLRSFEEAVSYPPNQAYIGNLRPDDLNKLEKPWYRNNDYKDKRYGKFGEIMPEEELYGLIKISDSFDLVHIEEAFLKVIKSKLEKHPMMNEKDLKALGKGISSDENNKLVNDFHAEPLYFEGKVIGCVKRAHDRDKNLTAHIMLENMVSKATGVMALKALLYNNKVEPSEIDYIIEASEEACGDMNQRGGGNFAKAIGEIVGCTHATGSDTRGFCAAPVHALVNAAALVQAGIYNNVVVVAGGATAKLGMNGKDHVNKGMPVLEDMLGAFAILISKNDGKSPIIRTDLIGRHTIGAGSAPQAVIQAIVIDPLDKGKMKITNIDKYSVEMQTPEITEPAGAGNVTLANYKMIAAMAVKRGEMEKDGILTFAEKHGMPGFAPTQGHIPSGVPFIGHGMELIMEGKIQKAMIIGKGSLFLARMTNQFDGVSFIMEKNTGAQGGSGLDREQVKKVIAEALKNVAKSLLEE